MDMVTSTHPDYRHLLLMMFLCMVVQPCGTAMAEGDNPSLTMQCASEIGYPPFCVVDAGGCADGFSVELMRAAAKAMGCDVVFRTGPWDGVKGMLERGEIDALPLVSRTLEREPFFDFTVPYLSMHGAIVVRKENKIIDGLEGLKDLRVAVMRGDSTEEFLRREERGFAIHMTETSEEALRGLSEDRFDAVFMQKLPALRLIKELGLTNLRIENKLVKGFRQDFCFAVHEGDKEKLELLNEGLALVIADGTFRLLHAKWFGAMELPSSDRIVVGGDNNYPPFEYLDENGRPAGYSVDMTRAVAQEAGLDIEIRLGPWPEIIEGLKTGEIDAIQGIYYSPKRDLDFDFSQAHTVNHCVSVTRKGTTPPDTLAGLAGLRIAVQQGDIMNAYVMDNGMEAQVTTFDTQEDALRELSEGKYDCALVARMTAMYCIRKNGWNNLKIASRPLLSPEYCYAVLQGNAALLTQLGEGLKVLEESGEYRRIQKKWMGVYEEQPTTMLLALRYSSMVIIPLLVVLLAVFLWLWSLRRQVARRTAELRRSEQQFRSFVEGAPDAIFVEVNQRFKYLNTTACHLFGVDSDSLLLGQPVLDRFHQGARDSLHERIRSLYEEGGVFMVIEVLALHMGGGSFPVEVSAVPIDYECEQGALVFFHDITQRSQAEARMRENEERLRVLFAQAADAIYMCDQNGRLESVNEQACRALGYSQEELLQLSVADIDVDSTSLSNLNIYYSTMPVKSPLTIESRHRRKDGSTFPVEITIARFELPDGFHLLKLARDITERKRAEEKIIESEQRYRMLFENAPVGIFSTTSNRRVTAINPTMARFLGFASPEELISRHDGQAEQLWVDPEQRADFLRLLRENGCVENYAFHARKANGQSMWLDMNARIAKRDADGAFHIEGFTTDVTKQKKVEAERERLIAAIEQAGEIFVITDTMGTIQYVNPAFERITGYTREEAIGANPRILKSGEHDEAFYHDLWRTISSGAIWEGRFINKRKDGVLYTEQATISPVRDDSGAIVNYVAVKGDITGQLVLEEQFRQSQKMESVGRLAGGVAHDFNNMLGVIIGHAELAMQGITTSEPLHADLEEIRRAAQRSADLTRQLLAFARKQTIAPRILDLNETVTGMLKMLRRLIGEDVELVWLPGADVAPVKMDPTQIDQILANLFVNARDAISGVGRITIETGGVTLVEAWCAMHAGFSPGSYVLLSVKDTGCGMSPETLANIFEPFYTTKEIGQGTGLGLSTVYGAVKQNHGFINVQSEPGKGTVFNIYLPRAAEGIIPLVTVDNTEPEHGVETVILAEDEPIILDLTKRMLTRLGYDVLAAGTPHEAVSMASSHPDPIHVLMTDVVMPEMDGAKLADLIKAIHPGIKLLYMSGYTADLIACRGVLEEGVCFIQKPFTYADLAAKMRQALDSA